MMTKRDLPEVLLTSLRELGGEATIVGICKYVWERYADELRDSGDLFYTWQYDIRWAATELRKEGLMKAAACSPSGVWQLSNQ